MCYKMCETVCVKEAMCVHGECCGRECVYVFKRGKVSEYCVCMSVVCFGTCEGL